MVTEGWVKMAPATLANFEDEKDAEARENFEKEFEALLCHQSRTALDREGELNLYRSGSAPPTVEAARSAAGSLFGHVGAPEARRHAVGVWTEEEMRSDPRYSSYYYSAENRNSRLPPPRLSREDWRASHRFIAGHPSIGDQTMRGELAEGGRGWSSLFSVQPGLPASDGDRDSVDQSRGALQGQSRPPSSEWLGRGSDGLIGLPSVGLGPRRKSFADAVQEDFGRSTSLSGHVSSVVSHDAFDKVVDPMGLSDIHVTHLHHHIGTVDGMHSGAASNGLVRVRSLGSTKPHSFASNLDSLMARSKTPEPRLIARSSSPYLTPKVGWVCDTDKKIVSHDFGSVSYDMTDCGDTTISLSGLNLSDKITDNVHNHVQGLFQQDCADHRKLLFNMPSDESQYIRQNIIKTAETESSVPSIPLQAYGDSSKKTGVLKDVGLSTSTSNRQINFPKSMSVYKKLPAGSTNLARPSGHYQTDMTNIDFPVCNSTVYSASQGPPAMLNSQIDAGAFLEGGVEGQYLNRTANQVGSGSQVPFMDQLYAQYRQRASDMARQSPAGLRDPTLGRTDLDPGYPYQEEYLEMLLAQHKMHYGASFSGKSGGLDNCLYSNPSFALGMPYPSQLSGSALSSLGPGIPLRQNDRLAHFPSTLRSATGGSKGSWNHENRITEGGFVSSLLEELKNSKTRSFELSEIVGHVVEFSADQYGSRFIQQKLETASVEEKNNIFPEVLPHAHVLMTDVFGNYVIQKFFEHGTESHRNQLADQLMGYVLPLSLQMYGCRVIQKALEVVDVDRQTRMVSELDGSVMKCVRDQNGNHVIQKCIECVPQERIMFIISSFYGQVVALSTHPYGCRVIQRVLEHCNDAKTQSIMIDEILQAVSSLAQDQYGNYVVQHVLQHGNKEERSAIIRKLAGQIVKMSQQKFASNVVEKCLNYGTHEERQLLINEILGSTDENEPLQAMMKDQYGNYVVQKVLEICDDQSRELILSRVKVHLNTLKKYTYGKHIVARVEKLITTGERRSAMPMLSST